MEGAVGVVEVVADVFENGYCGCAMASSVHHFAEAVSDFYGGPGWPVPACAGVP